MTLARRDFLVRSAAFGLGFAGLGRLAQRAGGVELLASLSERDRSFPSSVSPFGDLISDPAGLCDLPKGFSYSMISRLGEVMDDGLLVPGKHDGMATFAGPDGRTIIVRNHELELREKVRGPFGPNDELVGKIDATKIYDRGLRGVNPAMGGTTTLVFNTKTQKLERHFLSLAGTLVNCAGGPTPWGSWLSCEETAMTIKDGAGMDHGWVFEVPARAEIGLADPVPLKAMGRFRHEAVAFDPTTGICYLTEDLNDGLLYRFLPTKPGDLRAGGVLQALVVRGSSGYDTRNWKESPETAIGKPMVATWITLDNVESPGDTLRTEGHQAGAAIFARGEGMWFGATKGDRSVYFCCTSGGTNGKGQIWRYQPGQNEGKGGPSDTGLLTLYVEPRNDSLLDYPDNLTASPWGDLIVSEDGAGVNYLVGITPEGTPYQIARCPLEDHEWAGACFSPDGTTLFANVQGKGITVAITGPWKK
jgi:secreted PhoX family phosphatase